ncbi:CehA/McbA family metallohydrolase [Candidatus Bathyarchaeota archaeon]|nr:CehA/McbA family metallohydrolase [Candidatus Bathyarchaeota archaeon]
MLNDSELRVKVDLHVHTVYSSDSLITLEALVFYAKKRGLTAVAVTDHNRVDGALKMARETDFLIIPGTEVNSSDGHIVALNVQEPMPRDLSAEETVERIHAAGGIAVACHPFAMFKGSLGKHANGTFDAIETINASASPFKRSVRKAEEVAERFKLPRVAGTDAHYAPAVGYAYTLVDAELSVDAIVKAIAAGHCQPFGKPVPLRLKLEKYYHYFKGKIAGSSR